jgi:hypothetical protein
MRLYLVAQTKSIFGTKLFFSLKPTGSDSHFESTEKILIAFEIFKKKK